MKTYTRIAALALAGLGIALAVSSADARERLRKNETWCLETSVGGGDSGGTILQCMYETREQCIASKVSHADNCMRNPRL